MKITKLLEIENGNAMEIPADAAALVVALELTLLLTLLWFQL